MEMPVFHVHVVLQGYLNARLNVARQVVFCE